MEEYKIGYSYDINTCEYMGKEMVWLEKATGNYPCADNVTFKAPPKTGEHEAAVWNPAKGAWNVVKDFRGMPWWNADGSMGGIIDQLGDTEKITTEPPMTGNHEKLAWKNDSWVIEPADGWTTDPESGKIREMTQAEKVEAGLEPMPEGCKLVDGEIVALTMDELYTLGKVTLADYNEYIRQERENEYRRSTDKIGLMVLRGEATKERWEEAILAVKVKWPYKEA